MKEHDSPLSFTFFVLGFFTSFISSILIRVLKSFLFLLNSSFASSFDMIFSVYFSKVGITYSSLKSSKKSSSVDMFKQSSASGGYFISFLKLNSTESSPILKVNFPSYTSIIVLAVLKNDRPRISGIPTRFLSYLAHLDQ